MLKKLFIFSLFSLSLQAAGLGIYMLNVVNESTYEDASEGTGPDYGYSPGFGLSFDTNLGKNKVFGYRLNFEYYKASGTDYYRPFDSRDDIKIKYDVAKRVFSMVNILHFGLYRSEHVRLWIGPALALHNEDSNERDDYDTYTYSEMNIDVGPAIGLNYNINEDFSLSLDANYGILSSGTSALKARAYVFWRFGETFVARRVVQPIQQRPKPPVKISKDKTFEDKLEYLKSLREKDILTEEEYQLKRKELVQELKL